MAEKKEIARLEIICYEDYVETIGEGNPDAIIAGLAALIEDQSEENKFNFYMKSAISMLMMEAEQKSEKNEQTQPDA